MASNGIAIAALILVIFAIIHFNQNPPDNDSFSPGDFGDVIVNLFNQDGTTETTTDDSSPARTDMCSAYTTNYPTYFALRELQCGAAGGDFICTESKAGCFDISSWDHVYGCQSASDIQALKAMCSSLNGDWTCTATDVGCEY